MAELTSQDAGILALAVLILAWLACPWKWLLLKWIAGTLAAIAVFLLFLPAIANGLTS
ncbi:hypothetical protein [Glycomyces sp. NPDC048151]|uniref:hypothetical protein n=1 Tax=Glycomyces sp. NPDC048151 TaxID=3364002 RepID=UPI0037226861